MANNKCYQVWLAKVVALVVVAGACTFMSRAKGSVLLAAGISGLALGVAIGVTVYREKQLVHIGDYIGVLRADWFPCTLPPLVASPTLHGNVV